MQHHLHLHSYPFAPGRNALRRLRIAGTAGPATGYPIITADSLDEAAAASKGCPVLGGGANVDVFETFPVMEPGLRFDGVERRAFRCGSVLLRPTARVLSRAAAPPAWGMM